MTDAALQSFICPMSWETVREQINRQKRFLNALSGLTLLVSGHFCLWLTNRLQFYAFLWAHFTVVHCLLCFAWLTAYCFIHQRRNALKLCFKVRCTFGKTSPLHICACGLRKRLYLSLSACGSLCACLSTPVSLAAKTLIN